MSFRAAASSAAPSVVAPTRHTQGRKEGGARRRGARPSRWPCSASSAERATVAAAASHFARHPAARALGARGESGVSCVNNVSSHEPARSGSQRPWSQRPHAARRSPHSDAPCYDRRTGACVGPRMTTHAPRARMHVYFLRSRPEDGMRRVVVLGAEASLRALSPRARGGPTPPCPATRTHRGFRFCLLLVRHLRRLR